MPMSSGFVGRSGTGFEVGGNSLRLVGANNYYLSYASETMVEAVFALAGRLNLNVLRTWAFLDCDIAVSGTLPAGSQNGVYFQYWNQDTSCPEFNDGPNGLERLDQAIALAEARRLRLILPFNK